MTDFALKDNDIYLNESNDIAIVSDVDDMISAVTSSLKLWLKEYDYDISLGVNYNNILNNPHLTSEIIDYAIRKAILLPNQYLTDLAKSKYGIKTIQSIDYTINTLTRIITINAIILLNNKKTIAVSKIGRAHV